MKAIGIFREPEFESRVCMIPDTVCQIIQELKVEVYLEEDAGVRAGYSNKAYENAGAFIAPRNILLQQADTLLSINHIHKGGAFKDKKAFVGIFNLLFYQDRIPDYFHPTVSTYSLDMIPRTSKAQAMDVLSSTASISGYKAVIKAADMYQSALPMFTTAAGTLRPAKVLVLGAGVAGLQAIATARRLGAVVEAFDVRVAAAEEVESLGAHFIEVPGYKESTSAGGYALMQDPDYQRKQKELIADHISKAAIVISTANIPGKKAPILIEKEAIESMAAGSVIIDIAAEQGGNSSLTKNDAIVEYNSVKIVGNSHLSREMPAAASQLLSKNFYSFLVHLFHKDDYTPNDPILSGCKVISNGEVVHPSFLPKEEPLFV